MAGVGPRDSTLKRALAAVAAGTLLVLGSFHATAADLFGVVAVGEECLLAGTGCTDEGKLVVLGLDGAIVRVVGGTGLASLSALAFDPARSDGSTTTPARLVAARGVELHLIDPETAAPSEIASLVAFPPVADLPPGVVTAGPLSQIWSLDFDSQGNLYGIVGDTLTDFLARLDLSQVDASGRLEVEIIGVVGSTNSAYANAPIGFTSAQLAFDPTTGDLRGVGIDPNSGSAFPFFIGIQTLPGAIPLAQAIGLQANDIRSFARGMAADPVDGTFYVTGRQQVSPGVFEDVLALIEPSGEDRVQGSIDLDGQVAGLAFVTLLDENGPRPPSVTGFTPAGGNAGVFVLVSGSGFSANGQPNVSAVRFGPAGSRVDAFGAITVLGDDLLRAQAPDFETGPIEVSNAQGVAVSTDDFLRSEVVAIDFEASQGLPLYPLVRGKDTVFRLFPASSAATLGGPPVPVAIESAVAWVTPPVGDPIQLTAELYTSNFSNPPQALELSHRNSIDFYLSGDEFERGGTWDVFFQLRGVWEGSGPGPVILEEAGSFDFVSPLRREVTSLAIRCPERDIALLGIPTGFFDPEGNFVGPDAGSLGVLPRLFAEMSRVWPVRSGVSRLGDDLAAGVRFDLLPGFAHPVTFQNGEVVPLHFADVEDDLIMEVGAILLDAYSDQNADRARNAQFYFGDEFLECFCGLGENPGSVSFTVLQEFIPDEIPRLAFGTEEHETEVPMHELGHNEGFVSEESPNFDGFKNHSVHDQFETDPRILHPFNVPGRRAIADVPGTIMFPNPTFFGMTGKQFLEPFEYNSLVEEPSGCPQFATASLPVALAEEEAPSELVAVLRIGPDSATVLRSYLSSDRVLTPDDPASPYALVFLGAAGEILGEDAFPVSFSYPDRPGGASASTVVSVIRTLPEGTLGVEVRKDGSTLAAIASGPTAPEVQVVSPQGGESFGPDEMVTIQWAGSDLDGDALRYDVSYSPDGVRFLPIAGSVDGTQVGWSTELSAGSQGGIIRVTASDGLHRSSADSAPFSVASKPPLVSIIRPFHDQVFQQYDSIPLEGMAFDLEDGILDGAALQWSSDVDGPLGTGRRLDLPPATLSPGLHTLSLQATNDGVVTRSVAILVLADTDRDGLPDELEEAFDSLDPADPYDSGLDVDGDGLTAAQEAFLSTNPENPDSDGDGVPDGDEVASGSSPLSLPPILDAIGDQEVLEGMELTLVVGATDPDGDELSFFAIGLPEGASFDAGTGGFRYQPGFDVSTRENEATFPVQFGVADPFGERDTETVTLTVRDVNRPPVADAGADQQTECSQAGAAQVTLDGSASSDPDGDALSYAWTGPLGTASGAVATLVIPLGTHTVELAVDDGAGGTSSDTVDVTVEDATPPIISCNGPGAIVPPDAPIAFTATANDVCHPDPLLEVVAFDCFKFTMKGKRIDKTESCEIELDGSTITIVDSGGVGDNITWSVHASDLVGNPSEQECAVVVVNPGRACGMGPELALVLAVLLGLARRRRPTA